MKILIEFLKAAWWEIPAFAIISGLAFHYAITKAIPSYLDNAPTEGDIDSN